MQSLEQVILLIFSGQGLLLSAALLSGIFKKNFSNFFLGILTAIISFQLLNTWAMTISYHSSQNPFPFWTFATYLAIPPALWLFFKTQMGLKKIETFHWLMFLPAVIEFSVEMFTFYSNRLWGTHYSPIKNPFWLWFTEYIPVFVMIGVLVLIFRDIKRFRNQQHKGNKALVSKMSLFFTVFALITVFWLLESLFQFKLFFILNSILLVFLFSLSFLAYYKPDFFKTQKTYPFSQGSNAHNYNDQEELKRLEELFKLEKVYTEMNLSLSLVSDKLNLPQRYISQLINNYHQVNFNAFVNQYRVNDVIERIQARENSNKTLLALAMESGFSSKSSFNKIFKEFTDKTPSQYLENKS